MGVIRRCLGCSATYPPDEAVCPECGSYAGEHEEQAEPKPKPKPARRRKT